MAKAQNAKAKKKGGNANRRNVWLLVLTTVLVLGSIFMFTPPQDKINQGLDIQGGLSVVLSAKSTDGDAVTSEDMEKSRAIIEQRVNALGASEAVVQLQGSDQILVQIPGLSDTETALSTIGKTGKLEFARLDSFTDEDVKTKIENGQYGSSGTITDDFGNTLPSGKTEHLTVEEGTYTPLITGSNITKVDIGRASETGTDYSVNISLDSEGTKAFADATKDLASTKGKIVIILDGEVQSAPAVQSEITGGQVSITGGYDKEAASSMETVLESGSLPVSFEYAQSQVVGPTLGQDALTSGVLVAAIGLALVMLYLLVFYQGLGLITAAAMAVFAVLYLGILALLSHFGLFSLSMAGIAGVVLTIGMAADSSILTLERFREEIRMGRSVRAASVTGVRHGILTSIDADLVTMVSALTLFFLASASVKGFGLTLALGIICDIVMMLLFKAPIIRLLAPKCIAKHPGFWGVKDCKEAAPYFQGEKPASSRHDVRGRFIKLDINLLGYRKVFLSIAAVAIVLVVALVGVRGVNFGIEFVGGTSVTFHQGGNDATTEQVRSAFADAGEPDAVVQTTDSDGQAGFLVRTTDTSAESAAAAANKVADQFGWDAESFEVTTIGPDWGASVIQSSCIAFFVSLLLIIAYISVRFRDPKMGVSAVIALLHDLVIVLGVYVLVGREVTPNTIAALLTILGYSLYDTVVVFHRINDNMQSDDIKCTFMTMANHSINQVLVRTVNTTLTSLIPVLAMLLFGGETLKDFAFAMVIGLVCGSYSSIAVASPLYAMWKTREPRYQKLVKKFGPEVGRFEFGNPNAMAAALSGKKAVKATAAAASAAPAPEKPQAEEPHGATAAKAAPKPPKAKRKKRPEKK
ncbi:protein translocase subunit SecD [Senegalimassilia anaerobia]|uniref:protein translocase subunit SecD n=1 Tax=Senegalimassilia anaerobia TaxID=1473216 RepID=UPI003A92DD0F